MIRVIKLAVACLAVVVATTGQVLAGQTFYSDRAAFDAAAGTLAGFHSFEAGFTQSPSIDFGPFSVTETNDTSNFLFQSSGNPTDGIDSLGYIPSGTNGLVTFSFDSPINAFGFDIANNFVGSTITVGGDVSTTFSIGGPNASVFFGVIDNMGTFDTVTLMTNVSGGNMQIDSVSFGNTSTSTSAVPEPSSLTIFGIGACFMGIVATRRRGREQQKTATA